MPSKKEKKQKREKEIEKKVKFILEYRAQKYLERTCKTFLKNPIPENVAEHSFFSTIIGWVLAKTAKANENKVIKMCLVHDLAEVRGGEYNLINKFYNTPLLEEKILKEITDDYNLKDFEIVEIFKEFNDEKTIEAKLAKDADIISQMVLEKENLDMGNQKVKKWLDTSLKRLKTKEGKKLGKMLYEIDSDKWWLEIIKKHILKIKFLSPEEPFFHQPDD